MGTIQTPEALRQLKAQLLAGKKDPSRQHLVVIKVAMATCGIASGAREVMHYLEQELEKRNIEAEVIPTGCMGYCYAEPTIEVTRPGEEPITFADVDVRKADQIIEQYIKKGELTDGIIARNYELA